MIKIQFASKKEHAQVIRTRW